jgi:hypothetical protein
MANQCGCGRAFSRQRMPSLLVPCQIAPFKPAGDHLHRILEIASVFPFSSLHCHFLLNLGTSCSSNGSIVTAASTASLLLFPTSPSRSSRSRPNANRGATSTGPISRNDSFKMGWLTDLTGILAPFFIIASPVLSYSDQALSMQRNKSSAGFSLDIPLIMLVASFLRSESPEVPVRA